MFLFFLSERSNKTKMMIKALEKKKKVNGSNLRLKLLHGKLKDTRIAKRKITTWG